MRKTIQVGNKENSRSIEILHTQGANPALFWLGGFKSDMISTKATFLHELAQKHQQQCIRFDYSGHGVSGGDFIEGTISRWLEESLAVLNAIQPKEVILVGSSMGGWLALLTVLALKQSNIKVSGCVLIAPAVDMTHDLIWEEFSVEQKQTLMQNGFVEIPSLYSPQPYVFTKALIEDGKKHLLLDKNITIGCPIHILQGEADIDVPHTHALKIVKALPNDNITLTLVKDGDHRLSRDEDLKMLEKAINSLNAN